MIEYPHTAGADSLTDEQERLVLDELQRPGLLLVDALMRVRQADVLMLEAQSDPTVDVLEQAIYRVESARVVTEVALAAVTLAQAESRDAPQAVEPEDADEPPMLQPRQKPDDKPHAVQGVRFTAVLCGNTLGVIGNEPWLWVPDVGFICGIRGLFSSGEPTNLGYRVKLAGRIVSSTPTQALCVTDGGTPIALPHSVIEMSSEDDR